MLKSLDGPRRLLLSLALVAALTAIVATPALAVTNGQPDGTNHPQVGLMVALDGDGVPLWRCSGTLMSATVFLTAGHCTAPDGEDNPEHVEIWFAPGPIPLGAGYPSATPGDPCDGIVGYPCVGDIGGTPYTHPDWNPDAFFYRDLGIVILDAPYAGTTSYGTLPALNSFDAWKTRRGVAKVRFDSVGYGLQKSFPTAASWKNKAIRERMIAHPRLIQLNVPGFTGDFSLLLSNNTNTGGTCFGDSGGPNFIAGGLVVAGVTSFGLNGTCGGTGGVFRMDRQWSLDFVNDALTNGAGLDHYSGD